ncbi:hypothetical protein [Paraburkholderia sp. RL17-337-BIB-A]|uniref:hypothetical protein n=1 Tax=Paraburkholderia sp. RL17-337-BIB-A TaxID=3031636 RepID=UPI0038BB842F
MQIDIMHPPKLFRYSENKWLERSLNFGEFRLRPASDYKEHENDLARHDDELVRISKSPASAVTITVKATGNHIRPIGDITYRSAVGTNYLTVCFSDRWDEQLFDEFPNTDACLVIHNVEEFSDRFHNAVKLKLPHWAGMDAPVVYGGKSEYGPVFSKPPQFVTQHEWRFAWRPGIRIEHVEPVIIGIGSIANIAEIREDPRHKLSTESKSII